MTLEVHVPNLFRLLDKARSWSLEKQEDLVALNLRRASETALLAIESAPGAIDERTRARLIDGSATRRELFAIAETLDHVRDASGYEARRFERIVREPFPLPARKNVGDVPLFGFGFPNLATLAAGTYFCGFHGYGVNSYAFYFCEADDRRRVYFRLPYGGAYADEPLERTHVIAFLNGYARLREDPRLLHIDAVDTMGEGRWELAWESGARVEHSGTFSNGESFDPLRR